MKSKPKRILIVTSEFPPLPGGIGNHALNLAVFLERNGYQVQVIADQRTKDIEESEFDKQLNFQTHRIELSGFRPLMYLKRIFHLLKLIKTVDLVIATGKFSLWSVAFSRVINKKPIIAIIHGSEVNFNNSILRRSISQALKRFNSVIAVSNFTRDLVAHLNLKSLYVIPNGFDASEWDETNTSIVNIKGNPKLITVGNITERKGQLNVIKHLPYVLKAYPDLHYHCIGLPTEKDDFLDIAEQIGVANHVSFHGRVKHKDLADYLNSSDIFVMLSSPTSTGDIEGFGIAILEANHMGLPAIGSSGCGIEDAIEHMSSGLLIEPENTEQFIDALNTIIRNLDKFSEKAKHWANKHTWEKVILSYIEIIELS